MYEEEEKDCLRIQHFLGTSLLFAILVFGLLETSDFGTGILVSNNSAFGSV